LFLFSQQLLSETFLILRRIQQDTVTNVHRYSCEVPLLSSDFNEFSRQIFKESSNIKYHEYPSTGTSGWAKVTKETAAFHNSAHTPNLT